MPRIIPTVQPINSGFSKTTLPDPPQAREGNPGNTPQSSPLESALPTSISQAEIAARNKQHRSDLG